MSRVYISKGLKDKIIECASENFWKNKRDLLLKVANIYNIDIRIMDSIRFYNAGEASPDCIRICSSMLISNRLLSVVFHELGHVFCYRNNKWKSYHYKVRLKAALLTAYKAEMWVDCWGEKEFKKHFPNRKYFRMADDGWSSDELKDFYYNYVKCDWPGLLC